MLQPFYVSFWQAMKQFWSINRIKNQKNIIKNPKQQKKLEESKHPHPPSCFMDASNQKSYKKSAKKQQISFFCVSQIVVLQLFFKYFFDVSMFLLPAGKSRTWSQNHNFWCFWTFVVSLIYPARRVIPKSTKKWHKNQQKNFKKITILLFKSNLFD